MKESIDIKEVKSVKEIKKGLMQELLTGRTRLSGFKDKWGRSALAVCVISDDSAHVSSQLNEIVRFASQHHAVDMYDYRIQTM